MRPPTRQLSPTICRQALVRDVLARAQDPSDAVFMLHREMMAELRRELVFRRDELVRIVDRERKLVRDGTAGASGLLEQAQERLMGVRIGLDFVAELQASGA